MTQEEMKEVAKRLGEAGFSADVSGSVIEVYVPGATILKLRDIQNTVVVCIGYDEWRCSIKITSVDDLIASLHSAMSNYAEMCDALATEMRAYAGKLVASKE